MCAFDFVCVCVCLVLGACATLILSSLSLLFMQPIHYVVVSVRPSPLLPPCVPLSVWHAARFAFRYVSFFYYVLLPLSLLLLLLSLYSAASVFLQQIRYGTGVKKGLPCCVKGVPGQEL